MNTKRIILTLIFFFFVFLAKGQILCIERININNNVEDSNGTYGFIMNRLFNEPRVRLSLVIKNTSLDSIKLNTDNYILRGAITYQFNNKKIALADAGWMNSDDIIDIPYVCIAPNACYRFSLSFEPEPKQYFTIDNYRKHIWCIIPSIRVVIRQEIPEPLFLESEPINWKSITILDDERAE